MKVQDCRDCIELLLEPWVRPVSFLYRVIVAFGARSLNSSYRHPSWLQFAEETENTDYGIVSKFVIRILIFLHFLALSFFFRFWSTTQRWSYLHMQRQKDERNGKWNLSSWHSRHPVQLLLLRMPNTIVSLHNARNDVYTDLLATASNFSLLYLKAQFRLYRQWNLFFYVGMILNETAIWSLL